jgi:hypothetical protein
LLTSKGDGEVNMPHFMFLQLAQDNAHEQDRTKGGRGVKNSRQEKVFFLFIFLFCFQEKGKKIRGGGRGGCCFAYL